MRWLVLCSWLTLAAGAAQKLNTSVDNSVPLRVVFFDFDKTLVQTSCGEDWLGQCDPNCLNYSIPSCKCDKANALLKFFEKNAQAAAEYVNGDKGFGGKARVENIVELFETLKGKGILIRVLSTSWNRVPAASWAAFIAKFVSLADPSLAAYLPRENIIALADPGEGKAADKGQAAAKFLASHNWTQHNGILVDDSPANIAGANGKVDWVQVFPRTGMAQDVLRFLDQRATESQFTTSVDSSVPLKVVFFDFDKTLVTTSVGEDIITKCDVRCLNYSASLPCSCDLAKFFQKMTGAAAYVNGATGLGGDERVEDIAHLLDIFQKQGVDIRILSTAWGKIKGKAWAAFLAKFLSLSTPSLGQYFPVENIIALDDPGEGLSANKGQAAADYLSSHGLTQHNGILVDDSPSNIASATGRVDWIQVIPREGMAFDVMKFLANRARVMGARRTNTGGKQTTVTVTQTSDYCGGAAPDERMLASFRTPKPLASKTLYFYKTNVRTLKRQGEPLYNVTTNAAGVAQVNLKTLPDKFGYCVVDETKLGTDPVIPENDANNVYDRKCIRQRFWTCDLVLTTATASTVDYHTYCPWSTPCVWYQGSLPP